MDNNLKNLIIDEMFELNLCEIKIKEEINKNNSNEINFQKYGLLNKNWIEKYKKYYNFEKFIQKQELETPSDKQNNFEIEITDLLPKYNENNINNEDEDIKNIKCSFPTNFTIVSKNFIDLIQQHFYDKQNQDIIKQIFDDMIYEILIG